MNLFTYGTLSVDEVMKAVTGVTFRTEPGTLPGHYRARLKDQWFPGMIERPGEQVEGRLHLDVDTASWELLDTFESALYDRRRVRVNNAGGEIIPAMAYILPADQAHLLDVEWDEAWFRREKLSDYLQWAH